MYLSDLTPDISRLSYTQKLMILRLAKGYGLPQGRKIQRELSAYLDGDKLNYRGLNAAVQIRQEMERGNQKRLQLHKTARGQKGEKKAVLQDKSPAPSDESEA